MRDGAAWLPVAAPVPRRPAGVPNLLITSLEWRARARIRVESVSD
jgi:hypothetical protein